MLHIIIGNTGSGKTTYAHKLKEDIGGVVFSIDQWNKTLFLEDKGQEDGLIWFLERINRSEKLILDLIIQLESNKTNSILDLGFSKFEHREKFRAFAKQNSLEFKIHFLNLPKKTRWERVMQRNLEKGKTFEFEVSQEDFDFMESWFEPPNKDEMRNGISIE